MVIGVAIGMWREIFASIFSKAKIYFALSVNIVNNMRQICTAMFRNQVNCYLFFVFFCMRIRLRMGLFAAKIQKPGSKSTAYARHRLPSIWLSRTLAHTYIFTYLCLRIIQVPYLSFLLALLLFGPANSDFTVV